MCLQIEDYKQNKGYKIALCGDKKICREGFVCDDKMNYGTKVRPFYDYKVNLIRLHFTDGSRCEDGSFAQSTFTVICKEGDHTSTPSFIWVNFVFKFTN